MVLLIGMNALFGEQNGVMDYAAEARIPDTDIEELTIHHESLGLTTLNQLLEKVGGNNTGELVRHSDGTLMDVNDFEEPINMEDQNV